MSSMKKHILMFPFMAQGHLIPFLALSNLIAKRFPTYTVSFISTPLNIQNIKKTFPPNPNIILHSLPFCSSDHGLPPESENTDSLPLHLWLKLILVSESLQPHFRELICSLSKQPGGGPLLIVADVLFGWTVEIARQLAICHLSFTTCGAYGTAAYFSLWRHLPHNQTDTDSAHPHEFSVPGFPDNFRLHTSQLSVYLRAAKGSEEITRFYQRQTSYSMNSDAMICNTIEEMEVEGLRLLRQNTGLRVYAIGPLLPLDSSSSVGRVAKRAGVEEEEAVLKWLDSKKPGSVVYIAFGSQNTISRAQMMSLANGVEASGHCFVWVVRAPVGFSLDSEFEPEWLPEEFERRMKAGNRGVLVRGWAPQLEILSHESTGAFLSHCGWNSVLESLSRGVPLIGWPLASEQFYNAKMVEEELRAGVELARGVVEEVESEEVERVLRLVMEGEEGKEMRREARRLKEVIGTAMTEKGSSITALQGFLDLCS